MKKRDIIEREGKKDSEIFRCSKHHPQNSKYQCVFRSNLIIWKWLERAHWRQSWEWTSPSFYSLLSSRVRPFPPAQHMYEYTYVHVYASDMTLWKGAYFFALDQVILLLCLRFISSPCLNELRLYLYSPRYLNPSSSFGFSSAPFPYLFPKLLWVAYWTLFYLRKFYDASLEDNSWRKREGEGEKPSTSLAGSWSRLS